MDEIKICLQNKIATSVGSLQSTIIKAILNLYQRGYLQMSAKMVRDECISLNNENPWRKSIPAICNAMRNAINCGGRIIGEDRDFLGFKITFIGNIDSSLGEKVNNVNPKIPLINKKDKKVKSNEKITQINLKQKKLLLSKNFKVVMVCAKGKNNSFFTNFPNENYVNQPVNNNEHHPDETMNNGNLTWRDYLILYQNDGNLLSAFELYKPNVYLNLNNRYGSNFFILSAGWGLINSIFRLPKYNITFSSNPDFHLNTRNKNLIAPPIYNDFNQFFDRENNCLINAEDDIIFIGSPDYLPLFFNLTEALPNRKIIYWKKKNTPIKHPIPNGTFEYRYYLTDSRMRWCYELAGKYSNGEIP
jgi:hypothetical protein